MQIQNTRDLAQAFKQGRYSSVGGYPLFFITSDGAALSWEAVKQKYRQIVEAIRNSSNDGWRVVGHDVNWEDPALLCEHTGKRIESAYAEDQADN